MRANGTNYAATPCINLLRHPAWGRAQETYGEDPWLLGKFGVAATRALQAENVMACPKHFALNSLENSRFVVDVRVDERTLREVYLPHFKRTIQEGGAVSIMSAYNKLRGEYCAENEYLLTDILREDWGFTGFVSSDWVNGVYDGVAAVRAGLNVEMPWQNAYAESTLRAGLADGRISETDIDSLVVQSLRTRLPFAMANDQERYDTSLILNPEHIALARETAEQSMVLLKNEGAVLPFSRDKGQRIAVIGRLADRENTGDQGSSDSRPPYVVTPYAGLRHYHSVFANEVVYHDGQDLESARELAAEADQVVLVVGYTYEEEGEYIIFDRSDMEASAQAGRPVGSKGIGGDRESLDLPAEDLALIDAVAGANPQTALVYIGGSAINMAEWQDRIPAILFAWYPGMEGGTALARILYGDVNPSGKLPFTIAADPGHYPPFTPYTDTITYGYYHGYTLLDKRGVRPLYPFGYGLSYTTFSVDSLEVLTPEITPDDSLRVSIQVKNTGFLPGREVVQLYVGFANSAVDRPVKLLRGFVKLGLTSAQKVRVVFNVAAKDLAWYNPESGRWEVEAMEYEVYAGNSAAAEDLRVGRFRVVDPGSVPIE
jgi:beta-glucosidase